MAPVDDKGINEQDVVEYLKTRSDFDLELFAYRTLEQVAFFAEHGGAYVDPLTGKHRQFDVQAHALLTENTRLRLAVECKSLSVEAPLVVSRVPRALLDSFHEILHLEPDLGNRPAVEVIRQDFGTRARPLYAVEEPVGKHTAQPRKDGRGGFVNEERDSFDKWSQALSSAASLVIQDATHDSHIQVLVLVLPILLVNDGTLWLVDYSEAGEMVGDPKRGEEATLYVNRAITLELQGRPNLLYRLSHLHILTRTGFSMFLSHVRRPDSRAQLQERMFGYALRHLQGRGG
jgi:hypothetical protein